MGSCRPPAERTLTESARAGLFSKEGPEQMSSVLTGDYIVDSSLRRGLSQRDWIRLEALSETTTCIGSDPGAGGLRNLSQVSAAASRKSRCPSAQWSAFG